jgi:tetratricopeptide (TPR) repeat protein
MRPLILAAGLAFGGVLGPPSLAVDQAAAQPADASVFVARGIVAYQERRYQDALAELREALALDPKSVDAHYYSGLVLVALGRFDEAVRALEQARSLAPEDDAVLYQLGSVHFSQGRPQDAQPLLEQAFARNPRRPGLGSLVGMLRYQQGDYTGALRALTAETSTDPAVQQLTHLYRGLALGQLGLPERALAEAEEAIREQPSSPLAGPAERLRETILAASARQRRWSVELRGGVYYDTNVSATPLPSTDAISEGIRVSNIARDDKESPGEQLALSLEYAWLRQGPWEATVGYSFFQTLNNNASDFNIQDHLVALSGFYRGVLGAFPYQLGAQYAFDYTLLGGDSFLQRHGGTLFGSLAESSRHLTTVQGRIEWKDYTDDPPDPDENQDATNGMVGFVHTMFSGGGKHLIRLGYQFDVEAAQGQNFDYIGHRFIAGVMYTFPVWGLRLRYDFDFHRRDYQNLNTIFPAAAPGTVKRQDNEQNHTVRLELPLPHGLTLAFEYLHTDSQSNLAVYSFERDVYTLLLSWLY